MNNQVKHTAKGTAYLTESHVALIGCSVAVDSAGISEFLDGFPDELGFDAYLNQISDISDSARISKFAGQLCYMSFGPKATKDADAEAYFGHIIESGHESVLEHASVSFLFYGVSRALTHELVRHRHMSYSQLSQRYVGVDTLRFVERAEMQRKPYLHDLFEERIDAAAYEYDALVEYLVQKQEEGEESLTAEGRTNLRKKVRQLARDRLPNEVEAPIVVSGNHRSWREFLAKRATEHADTPIRALAMKVHKELVRVAPEFYQDIEMTEVIDGTTALKKKKKR